MSRRRRGACACASAPGRPVAQAMEAARFRIRKHGEREGWSALVCYTPSYAQA